MRIGEVLKLKPMDIDDRKAIIRDAKSGRAAEAVFLPQKVADRLRRYIRENEIKPDERIFPLTYAAARLIVKKAGNLVGIHVRPLDLRRHATTYASRSGTPLEIVSTDNNQVNIKVRVCMVKVFFSLSLYSFLVRIQVFFSIHREECQIRHPH